MSTNEPLVAVITPVYNGAAYLAECIESVLRQTYTNWTYTISDNASTDDTVDIALRYAARDSRITVRQHKEFLPQIANWNRSLEQLDRNAAYVKMIHADDWMFPDCLAEMVAVAENNPSVGIVSAYRLEETYPSLGGIPAGQAVTAGHEVCRKALSHKAFVFGSPSNTLVRGDLVRKLDPFYDPTYIHADYEVCLRILQESDLGFAFKVLTFTRRHNESHTSRFLLFNTYPSEDLWIFKRYGPAHFTEAEFQRMMALRVRSHYRFLGKAVFQRKSKAFWDYQRDSLGKIGMRLSYVALAYGALFALLNIPDAIRYLRRRVQPG